MIIDLHLHQMKHSSDSKLDMIEAIKMAKTRGLDGLCVTDHDDMGYRELAQAVALEMDFPIFVGVEIYSLDGDILCFGIDAVPEKRLSAQETIDYVNARGGVTVAAHPFRNNNRGLGNRMKELKGLGAVEAYNGRTDDFSNFRARISARELNLPLTGGSDAHTCEEVGNFATRFLSPIKTMSDLVEAIKRGAVEPVSRAQIENDEQAKKQVV